MNQTKKVKKVGLALGGGATKGVAMFSLINEIKKCNVEFEVIAGTSVGAIIGSYYALYGEIDSLKEKVMGISTMEWLKFADVNAMPKKSLIKGKIFHDYFKKLFGNKKFSDTKIPLIIPVTNLSKQKVEYVNKGKIVDAIVASSAYPGIFPYVESNRGVYVDGGVLDNLPYEILLNKSKKVVAINLSEGNENRNFDNLFDVVHASIDLMVDNAFKRVEQFSDKVFMFSPKFKGVSGASFSVTDLDKKYIAGEKEFLENKKRFLKWLDVN